METSNQDRVQQTVTVGKIKECCQKEENLYLFESNNDLVVMKCKVCGCRHFELTLAPGHIGVTGAKL